MHPDQVWGNPKYNKEYQVAFRKVCEKQQKTNDEYWKNHINPHVDKYEAGRKLQKEMNTRQAQCEIISPFVRNWLEGEIAAARIALIVGMILTALIKGQIVLWAIMYIAYRGRVKKAKQDAIKADRRQI